MTRSDRVLDRQSGAFRSIYTPAKRERRGYTCVCSVKMVIYLAPRRHVRLTDHTAGVNCMALDP